MVHLYSLDHTKLDQATPKEYLGGEANLTIWKGRIEHWLPEFGKVIGPLQWFEIQDGKTTLVAKQKISEISPPATVQDDAVVLKIDGKELFNWGENITQWQRNVSFIAQGKNIEKRNLAMETGNYMKTFGGVLRKSFRQGGAILCDPEPAFANNWCNVQNNYKNVCLKVDDDDQDNEYMCYCYENAGQDCMHNIAFENAYFEHYQQFESDDAAFIQTSLGVDEEIQSLALLLAAYRAL